MIKTQGQSRREVLTGVLRGVVLGLLGAVGPRGQIFVLDTIKNVVRTFMRKNERATKTRSHKEIIN
jgi:hypothetical protein